MVFQGSAVSQPVSYSRLIKENNEMWPCILFLVHVILKRKHYYYYNSNYYCCFIVTIINSCSFLMAFLKASATGMKGSLEEFQVCLFLYGVPIFPVTKINPKTYSECN